MTPAWILDIFAALMLVVAAVSAARLVAARPWQRGAVIIDTDMAHLLMAIAMAGMLAPSLTTLPNARVGSHLRAADRLVRATGSSRDARANGVRALAGGHCAPHLVHSAAMLYMFAAIAAPAAGGGSGMSGMGGASAAMQTLQLPHPGLRLRADPDRLQHLGPRPAVRQALQHVSPRARRWPCPVAVPAMAGAEPATAAFAAPGRRSGMARRTCRGSAAAEAGQAAAGGAAAGSRSAPRRPCSRPRRRSAAGSRWESPWPSCCSS